MKSNNKRLGDYIKEVKVRNSELKAKKLLGINIDKFFMPSVANVIGTDMSVYKIVKTNQFACNRMHVGRDKRLPVALSKMEEDFMVSPAYDVFEIIDSTLLLPEYLMMWFTRKEFDRNSWFYTDADVRGGLAWKAFIDMQLPIPILEKQKEIVKEYRILVNRIDLNNQLITKLEETAQTIYKQWFVDFEFPDANGLPYKSNGGEMIESELGEIPKGWQIDCLSGIATYLNGLAMQKYSSENEEYLPVIKIRELSLGYTDKTSDKASTKIPKQYIIENGDIIFSWSGTLKVEIWTGGKGGLNQHLFKVTSKKFEKWFCYLWTNFHLQEFIRIAAGKATSLGHIKREHLNDAKVLVPNDFQIIKMNNIMNPIFNSIINKKIEIRILSNLINYTLSSLANQNN